MSALIAEEIVSEPSSNMSAITIIKEDPAVDMSEPTQKSKKAVLRGYRQRLMTIKARIRYHEYALKTFRKHLKNGSFPQRMKSIKPYPKMNSPEAQSIVNEACDQVQCVILDQMILDEEKKLMEDQDSYQALKVQRQGDRQQLTTPKNPKKPTMTQLQQELKELQSTYTQLCSKLETPSE